MSSFESKLKEFRRLKEAFQQLVIEYPKNIPYQETLLKLESDIAKLTNTIGRK